MSLSVATVTSLSPLQVATDGSTSSINALNVSEAAVIVGSRVVIDEIGRMKTGKQIVILGVLSGTMTSLRVATGIATVAAPTINTYSIVAVTFPVGRFTAAPRIALGLVVSGPGTITTVGCDTVTASGMNVGVVRSVSSSTPIHWTATQENA